MQDTPHIMGRYDKDLAKLKKRILDMGDQVITQLSEATDALAEFDAQEVDRLVAFDRTINGMQQDIYKRAERLIALRQPMAMDLRQSMLPIMIAHELERIGDYAKFTAKRARKLAESDAGNAARATVEKISASVQGMLQDALKSYDNNDTDLAAEVRDRDPGVDQMVDDLFASQIETITADPQDAETHVHLILLARSFERSGDHVVNIARYVHQIETGIDLKASD